MLAAGVDTLVLGCTHYPFVLAAVAYLIVGDGSQSLIRPRQLPDRQDMCYNNMTCRPHRGSRAR